MRRTVALTVTATVTTVAVVAAGLAPAVAAPRGSSERVNSELTAPRVDSRVAGELTVVGGVDSGAVVPRDGAPVEPPASLSPGAGTEAVARAFVAAASPVYGVDGGTASLRYAGAADLGGGEKVARFEQIVRGVPVYAGELAVHLTAGDALVSITGEIARPAPSFTAQLSAAAARSKALRVARTQDGVDGEPLTALEPQLHVYDPLLVGEPDAPVRPVWRTVVTGPPARGIAIEVLVDAVDGRLVKVFSRTAALRRSICDNRNSRTSNLAAGSWCTPSDPNGLYLSTIDAAANPEAARANRALLDVSDFYRQVLGVDLTRLVGLDTSRPYPQRVEPVLTATVNYCEPSEPCPYVNAFWADADPLFRPGGGRVYPGGQVYLGRGLDAAEDVVAHEVAHGVTSAVNGLKYFNQSGAINESMSDVFGQLSQLYEAGNRNFVRSRDTRWLIGERIDVPDMRGAVRSMSNPGTMSLAAGDPQPSRMTSEFWEGTRADNGGVHTNNGVGNKTAFLIARGGTFNGLKVSGIGERWTAKLYWRAQHLLTSGADYRDLAVALALACNRLYGASSRQCRSVRTATAATEMSRAKLKVSSSSYARTPGKTRTLRARLVSVRGNSVHVPSGLRTRLLLERKVVGAKRWKRVGYRYVSTSGRATWSIKPRSSTRYRVTYAGSPALGLRPAATTLTLRLRR